MFCFDFLVVFPLLNLGAAERDAVVEITFENDGQLHHFEKDPKVHFMDIQTKLGPNFAIAPDHHIATLKKKMGHSMVRVVHKDFQKLVNDERRNCQDKNSNLFLRSKKVEHYELSRCHPFDEIQNYIKFLAEKYPEKCSLMSLGKSYENRNMWILKISSNRKSNSRPKKAIWVDATIHAREWQTTASLIYVLTHLLNGTNWKLKQMLRWVDWYFVPVVNPDGYVYSWESNRMQRKNREPPPPGNDYVKIKDYGTDLNRNFPYAWGQYKSRNDGSGSDKPEADTYIGTKPASAVETRNLMNGIKILKNHLRAAVHMHAQGGWWLLPYGNCSRENIGKCWSKNHEEIRSLAGNVSEAIEKRNKVKYKVGLPAQMAYPVGGDTMGWTKSIGVPYTFTPEVWNPDYRPYLPGYLGFLFKPEHIVPTGKDMIEGFYQIAKRVHRDS